MSAHLARLSKYTLVAGVLFLGNISIAVFLAEVWQWHYLLATATGLVAHAVAEFFVNKNWIFNSPDTRNMAGLAKTAIIEGGVLGLITFIMWMGVEVMGLPFIMVRIAAAILALLWCYTLNVIWTFKGEQE